MFARNVLRTALFLLTFAVHTSCSRQDEPAGGIAGEGEIVTTVGVNVPELFKTRTATLNDVYAGEGERYLGTSGMPSIGNVDLGVGEHKHPLTFTVGVYVKEKQGTGYVLVNKQSHQAEDDNAYFEFRLLKDQEYRLVAYADFNTAPKDDLESISYTTALNDECSDAFYASEDFVAKENIQVVLKRPFGKLRLVAHDFNTLAAGEAFKINKVTVKYHRAPMLATDTFNALTGEFNYDENAEGEHTVEAVPVVYKQEYTDDGKAVVDESGKEGPVAVFTMYLPANYGDGGPLSEDDTPGLNPDEDHVDENAVPQSWFYPFDVIVEYENANGGTTGVKTIESSYTIDIPVKRNWLTTVDATHFWTGKSGVMVTVHAAFDGEIKAEEKEQNTVKSAAELQAAIDKICEQAKNKNGWTEAKIVLGGPIDVSASGGIMIDNWDGGRDLNHGVIIHLDLNNYTITSDGTNVPGGVNGMITVSGRNNRLYIDDSSKEAKGGIEYKGTDDSKWCSLITCKYGGQVVINRGNFVSSSPYEAIYVYESEQFRALAQIAALKAIGVTPQTKDDFPEKPTDPALLQKIEKKIKQLTSTVTINGGWFENAIDSSIPEKDRVVINPYNVKEYAKIENGVKTGCWATYHDYAKRQGYPDWTDWGPYVNQCFGFVYINGGSFVEQDPSKGDNIVGNVPTSWIGNGHIQTAIVDGKTVYTVIPEDLEHEF